MTSIPQVYVVSAVRTPFSGDKKGSLRHVKAIDLGLAAVRGAVQKANLDPKEISHIEFGCATQIGTQGGDFANTIGQLAFRPHALISGSTVNKFCGSAAKAIANAWGNIAAGQAKVVIAGGAENTYLVPQAFDLIPPPSQGLMGNIQRLIQLITLRTKIIRQSLPKGFDIQEMGHYGDAMARRLNISRKQSEDWTLRTHSNAAFARDEGYFDDQIVPIQTKYGVITRDEGIRDDTTLTKMATMKTSFGKAGINTAATSSPIVSIGGAALVLAGEDAVKDLKLAPIARIVSYAEVPTDSQVPEDHLYGIIPAINEAVEKAKSNSGIKSLDDIDIFEVNEAFAVHPLAVSKKLGVSPEKINPNGGALAFGHPLGATAARLSVFAIHEMQRRAKASEANSRFALEVQCIAGGQANAIVYERV